ncbi:MAG: SDR family oxidoreductase [Alphaproteobacteria bacterium]|nr:SDR family oxidoreductase [Alphaproteobacteria bacterium]
MAGKKGLIMGVANEKSIAWGIASAVAGAGAELAFTYQNEAIKRRVEPLAAGVGSDLVWECDVSDEASLDTVAQNVRDAWGEIDFAVHAVAFSDKAELKGRYADTSRDNFLRTVDISCYSFTALCQRLAPMMRPGGSFITLTYLGAERTTPNYNVMGVAKAALEASVRYLAADLGPDGVRVNAISAGPMRTLAGSAIADARYTFRYSEAAAPMKRNVALDEVGKTGLYLLSELSSGVTGEIMHVDAGFHVVGIPRPQQQPPRPDE